MFKKQISQRHLRVFISSTFRDMQDERDFLVKYVFPELRRRCRERGIEFTEVDLRWGVTEEQAEKGEVLPICLAEIEQSRPYFIGLLGERYGYIPPEIHPELLEEQEWLAEQKERSLTELEILHGVLNNPEMADRAYFYFRAPTYLESIPKEKRDNYKEESQEAKEKLHNLKERIRDSGLPLIENYLNPQELGKFVLEQLWRSIDTEFPAEVKTTPLDREISGHEIFAENRCKVYIGQKEYYDVLETHAAGVGPPLIVLGESGSGKSALLASWTKSFREKHKEFLVITHFIGATSHSTNWQKMLTRILGEFKEHFDINKEIPEKPDELKFAFANWLQIAAVKGKVVLVLDGLNQLEDWGQGFDLSWLPTVIPSNVRLVISTLPGSPLNEIRSRGWTEIVIKPLEISERKLLIEAYLAQYSKKLDKNRVERLAASSQTGNPLFLRTLLDELRVFGVHEHLDVLIAYYLESETIGELYTRILKRFEEDYESQRPGLVRDVMTLIWSARRGLTENELLELLGKNGNPVPIIVWSPLRLAAGEMFISRSGLITFTHNFLRQVVEQYYLIENKKESTVESLRRRLHSSKVISLFTKNQTPPQSSSAQIMKEKQVIETHLRLADYFAKQKTSHRKFDELPWHLMMAQEWERLYLFLKDLSVLGTIWEDSKIDAKMYWAKIESNSKFRRLDAYKYALDFPQKYNSDFLIVLSELLRTSGHWEDAYNLNNHLLKLLAEKNEIGSKYAHTLNNQAIILSNRGNYPDALNFLRKTEHICRELGDKLGVAAALKNQATIQLNLGDYVKSNSLCEQAKVIFSQLNETDGLQNVFGCQADIHYRWGDIDHALSLYRKQENICRQSGNLEGLAHSLHNQSIIYRDLGNWDKVIQLLDEAFEIYRQLGDQSGIMNYLGEKANILFIKQDYKEAMATNIELEKISRQISYPKMTANALVSRANIYQLSGKYDEAMALYKESEEIQRKLDNPDGLFRSLSNQAVLLRKKGDLIKAMSLHKESEEICRKLSDLDGLSKTLLNQANIFADWHMFDESLRLLKEAEAITRKIGNVPLLLTILDNQRHTYSEAGEIYKAVDKLEESYRVASQYGFSDQAAKIKQILEEVNNKF